MGKKPEIVVMVGLPGSGKSTTIAQYEDLDYEIISLDVIGHGYSSRQKEDDLLSEYLSEGKSIIVDNTNVSKKNREKYFDFAQKYDATISAIYIDVDVKTSLHRNSKRKRKKRVPNAAIYSLAKNLEIPTIEEGFDVVKIID